jgi:Holliday junction resolvase RusA-like endonuclease
VSQKNSKVIRRTRSGRAFIASNDGVTSWRNWAALILRQQRSERGPSETINGRLISITVILVVTLAKGQRIDVDNLAAAPLDALVDSGIISDDRWIDALHVATVRDRDDPSVWIGVVPKRRHACATKVKARARRSQRAKESRLRG